MYCPYCLSELRLSVSFVPQLLGNRYVCTCRGFLNKQTGKFEQCLCNKYQTFWGIEGEYYNNIKTHGKIPTFYAGAYACAAINSFAKKCEVEVFRLGLKKHIYLPPALCFWFLQPIIDVKYASDYLGNITKKTFRLRFLKKEKNTGKYITLYIPQIVLFFHVFRRFHDELMCWKYLSCNRFYSERLYYFFINEDRRAYRKIFRLFLNLFYCGLKKKLKKIVEN